METGEGERERSKGGWRERRRKKGREGGVRREGEREREGERDKAREGGTDKQTDRHRLTTQARNPYNPHVVLYFHLEA